MQDVYWHNVRFAEVHVFSQHSSGSSALVLGVLLHRHTTHLVCPVLNIIISTAACDDRDTTNEGLGFKLCQSAKCVLCTLAIRARVCAFLSCAHGRTCAHVSRILYDIGH